MKHSHAPFEYPVVIKQTLDFIVVSVPDLGITMTEELPPAGRINKDYVTKIATTLAKTWIRVNKLMIDRSIANIELNSPSKIRQTLGVKTDKEISAPRVAKILGVHPDTVRRMADRGELPCFYTPGGHRRFLEGHIESFRNKDSD